MGKKICLSFFGASMFEDLFHLGIQQVMLDRPENFMIVLMESDRLGCQILNKNGMTQEFFA